MLLLCAPSRSTIIQSKNKYLTLEVWHKYIELDRNDIEKPEWPLFSREYQEFSKTIKRLHHNWKTPAWLANIYESRNCCCSRYGEPHGTNCREQEKIAIEFPSFLRTKEACYG